MSPSTARWQEQLWEKPEVKQRRERSHNKLASSQVLHFLIIVKINLPSSINIYNKNLPSNIVKYELTWNIGNNPWSQILSTMTSCQQGALPLTGNCARTLVKNAATHISGVTRWASWAWRWNFKISWYCGIKIISSHNFVKSGSLEGSLRPTSTVDRGTWLMTWWWWKCRCWWCWYWWWWWSWWGGWSLVMLWSWWWCHRRAATLVNGGILTSARLCQRSPSMARSALTRKWQNIRIFWSSIVATTIVATTIVAITIVATTIVATTIVATTMVVVSGANTIVSSQVRTERRSLFLVQPQDRRRLGLLLARYRL